VNHINYDTSDARAVNLEWATHKENNVHSALAGRLGPKNPKHGVDHRSAKLTDDDVRKIREMSATGLSNAKVAKVFGINRSCVSRIKTGRQWKHVV
jgi:DNA invertase Pin-like site-specific DNA recombinase